MPLPANLPPLQPPEYSIRLAPEKTTYAPGDDIFVNVQLVINPPVTPTRKFIVGGTVALIGEEKATVVEGVSGTAQLLKPVVVFLEGSTPVQGWRVRLQLPEDVLPSCELGAVPPCGSVVYLVTCRLQIAQGPLVTSAQRIRVVSSRMLTDAKAADVPGVVMIRESWRDVCTWCMPKKELEHPPELRVTLHNSQASFRPGESIKYRVVLRGSAPKGGSFVLPRIDALEVSIWRAKWFSDGRGSEISDSEIVKPPQAVDFSGSAAGMLPVDFRGSVTVPLGLAPTVRGILVSNDYDLVVKVYSANRECGSILVPITVFRDLEGTHFSPTLQAARSWTGSHHPDAGEADFMVHGAAVGFDEDEEMDELALT